MKCRLTSHDFINQPLEIHTSNEGKHKAGGDRQDLTHFSRIRNFLAKESDKSKAGMQFTNYYTSRTIDPTRERI